MRAPPGSNTPARVMAQPVVSFVSEGKSLGNLSDPSRRPFIVLKAINQAPSRSCNNTSRVEIQKCWRKPIAFTLFNIYLGHLIRRKRRQGYSQFSSRDCHAGCKK